MLHCHHPNTNLRDERAGGGTYVIRYCVDCGVELERVFMPDPEVPQ